MRTVLMVDDEVDLLAAFQAVMAACVPDLRVLVAADGPAAFAILERERVDAVVCDYRLPGMGGTQVLAQVRARWPNVQRMMLTGLSDREVDNPDGELIRTKTGPPLDLVHAVADLAGADVPG